MFRKNLGFSGFVRKKKGGFFRIFPEKSGFLFGFFSGFFRKHPEKSGFSRCVLYSFENYKVKKILSGNNLVIAITNFPPKIINLVIASLRNVRSRVRFHRTKVLLPPFESSHRDLSEFDSFEYLRQSQQKSFRMIPNRARSVQISLNQSKSIRINPNRSKSVQINSNRRN